ncbi:MAG: hypothetical protein ACK4IS_10820 [Erythrobacter sp.]
MVLRAASAYWAVVFALGFVLGTLRTLWLAPAVGVTAATIMELPIMLAASWWAAGLLVRRFALVTAGAALKMGALAFALLMAAELALAMGLMGKSPGEWLGGFAAFHAQLGLAGQIAFALMPWWRAGRGAISA